MKRKHVIYFLRSLPTGHIKIGFTDGDIFRRIDQLQGGNPVGLELILILSGTRETEKFWHKVFAKDRHAREWFNPSERLLKFISTALHKSEEIGEFIRQQEIEAEKTA